MPAVLNNKTTDWWTEIHDKPELKAHKTNWKELVLKEESRLWLVSDVFFYLYRF